MLSQGERRQLQLIASQLEREDPGFAAGLRTGVPTVPTGNCRWPLVAGAVLAGFVLFIAVSTAALVFMGVSIVVLCWTGLAYRRQVRKAHGGGRRRKPGMRA